MKDFVMFVGFGLGLVTGAMLYKYSKDAKCLIDKGEKCVVKEAEKMEEKAQEAVQEMTKKSKKK